MMHSNASIFIIHIIIPIYVMDININRYIMSKPVQ